MKIKMKLKTKYQIFSAVICLVVLFLVLLVVFVVKLSRKKPASGSKNEVIFAFNTRYTTTQTLVLLKDNKMLPFGDRNEFIKHEKMLINEIFVFDKEIDDESRFDFKRRSQTKRVATNRFQQGRYANITKELGNPVAFVWLYDKADIVDIYNKMLDAEVDYNKLNYDPLEPEYLNQNENVEIFNLFDQNGKFNKENYKRFFKSNVITNDTKISFLKANTLLYYNFFFFAYHNMFENKKMQNDDFVGVCEYLEELRVYEKVRKGEYVFEDNLLQMHLLFPIYTEDDKENSPYKLFNCLKKLYSPMLIYDGIYLNAEIVSHLIVEKNMKAFEAFIDHVLITGLLTNMTGHGIKCTLNNLLKEKVMKITLRAQKHANFYRNFDQEIIEPRKLIDEKMQEYKRILE